MESEKFNQPVNYAPCLICSSSVIPPEIKVEPCLDKDDDWDDESGVISFLLTALLEIPKHQVVEQQEKLINQKLNTFNCESCTKLIYSVKEIYREIFELTLKFRQVQKQIVEQFSKSVDLQLGSSNHNEILRFCRKFLKKNNFNSFGFPFVVKEIPVKKSLPLLPPEVDKVKEEPISDEDEQSENDLDFVAEPSKKLIKDESPKSSRSIVVECDEDKDPLETEEDKIQNSSASSSEQDDSDSVSQSESDSDSEPSPPPPKKTARKIPLKKASSSSSPPPKKENRKSSTPAAPPRSAGASTTKPKPPRLKKKKKPAPPKKTSRFDRLYPNYPHPRIRNPTTKLFHCSEPSCSKTSNRKTRLETHIMIEHLQDNYFKCEVASCGKSYANPEVYQDHVSWHAGIPRWKCEEKVTPTTTCHDPSSGDQETLPLSCPEAFYSRRKLNRHVQKVHQKDKPFICETCGMKFNCQDYLTSHKFVKHTEKGKVAPKSYISPTPQICDYCGKSYSGRKALEIHINMVHDNSVGKFACKFCDHRFLVSTHLKIHMYRKHKFSLDGFKMKPYQMGGYKFKCEVKRCKMRFSREETYKKHMEEKHREGMEEVYEFHCKYCGKGFHRKHKMDYHEEAHLNKESKPFSCEICGRRFATMPYLKNHKKNIHKIPMENARKKMNCD